MDFAEPDSMNNASDRRDRIVAGIERTQSEIAKCGKATPAQMKQRGELFNQLEHLKAELRFLKAWCAKAKRGEVGDRRRMILELGETGGANGLLEDTQASFAKLRTFVRAIMEELQTLRSENRDLRENLEALTAQPTIAPGSGVDEWRNEK